MRVNRRNLKGVLKRFATPGAYSFDTETTGLKPYQGDRLFALVLCDGEESYYFDTRLIPWSEWREEIQKVFAVEESIWFAHNAKFDLAILLQEGIIVHGKVHCTQAIGRVEKNNRFRYDLDSLAKEIGLAKHDGVKEWIREHNAYKYITNELGEKEKHPDFTAVPIDLMELYACQDAMVGWKIGEHQRTTIQSIALQSLRPERTPLRIMHNEIALTKVFFDMEARGVKVDLDYCRRAARFELERMNQAAFKFQHETGIEFKDSRITLATAFDKMGYAYPKTEKGNASFKDSVLEGLQNPVAETVRTWRDASKKRGTYYLNFIYFADSNGVIHCNFRQGGTETGRISASDPNLQNLNKEEDTSEQFLVRRAFVPRENFFFLMLDYDQMEYRLMLDIAGELGVIAEVLKGVDVHQATANMMGVSRKVAKTINFMLLYGGGVDKLAATLGVTRREAQRLKDLYFSVLPRVRMFVRSVAQVAESRGYTINWAGRYNHLADKKFSYAMPNHLIQGGCADIVKLAMPQLQQFLKNKQSKMILQIHDEILFEIHKSEAHIIPELRRIMENVYPYKHVPMTVGIEWSNKSWADKMEWKDAS